MQTQPSRPGASISRESPTLRGKGPYSLSLCQSLGSGCPTEGVTWGQVALGPSEADPARASSWGPSAAHAPHSWKASLFWKVWGVLFHVSPTIHMSETSALSEQGDNRQ